MEIEKMKISKECPICGKDKKHSDTKPTHPSLWSKTCGSRECIKKLTQSTNLSEYGHVSNLHSKLENGKTVLQDTINKRYNVDNVSQLEKVKQKKQETCLENFGVRWPMQSTEVKAKSTATIMDKYGYDNVSKAPSIIQKIRHTQVEKYGMLYMQTDEGKKLLSDICMEKYGVEWYFNSTDFKNKLEKRCMELFGVTNPFFSANVQANIAKRNSKGKSKEETKWLDSLGILKENRQVAIKSVTGKNYIVDGYDPETNTVYEWNGSFWHGNPEYYDGKKDHPVIKEMTYGDLYEKTIKKQQDILESGYNLISEWSKV
jgi:hypothetical protein